MNSRAILSDAFLLALVHGEHRLPDDPLYALLTDQVMTGAARRAADVVEIPAGNGYEAGGQRVEVQLRNLASAVLLAGGEISWRARGGSIGPFRHVVLYNARTDAVICFLTYPRSCVLLDGEYFTLDLARGLLKLCAEI